MKYYSAFGRPVAVRKAGTLSYLLADHLGSTVALLDTNGSPVTGSPQKYWPYGATRSGGVTQTDKLYTGQQQESGDAALGLYNYKARFYSTVTGRRRAEVLNLTAGDITQDDGKVWYRYRGKGGKTGKRELPQPAFVALTAALSAFGRDIAAMGPDASLWPTSGARARSDERDVLRQPPALLEGGRAAAGGRTHLPPLGGEAPARCGRVDRKRHQLPRSLVVAGDVDLPAAAGGRRRTGAGGRWWRRLVCSPDGYGGINPARTSMDECV